LLTFCVSPNCGYQGNYSVLKSEGYEEVKNAGPSVTHVLTSSRSVCINANCNNV